MDNIHCTDRFIGNLVVSWLVACWAVMAVDSFSMDMPLLRDATPRVEIAVAAAVAAFVLFAIPYLVKRVARTRPSIFADDAAGNKAAFRGRLVGLSIGLLAGIMVQGM
ncbi:hypothetical protein KDW69_21115 [Burkholderia ambifaria]|uniref:hypothetical protein n=1 Tax=Burkholderia ambifaria TaxID=152480 RepID=UPI001BA0116C|nr:hypothetical protein [Burkholderia ambifaria]MBR8334158.1 hypothetical protein [Burkholderia ambifaria]